MEKRTYKDIIADHALWAPGDKDERFRFFVLALCGEAGELANLVKKEWREFGAAGLDYFKNVEKELCDVYAYTHMIAHTLGIDLEKATMNNAMEVEQRPEWIAFRNSLLGKRHATIKE